jgi:hypothetical protein
VPKPDWPRGGETVSFRLGDSDLAQWVRPDGHDEVLTGEVVHVYSSEPEVDVKAHDWKALHTVRIDKLLPDHDSATPTTVPHPTKGAS